MTKKWDTIFTAVLVACALATTATLVRRELLGGSLTVNEEGAAPVFFEEWRTLVSPRRRLGPEGAPVQLIEFGDFECPACSAFHKTIEKLRERYPTQVSLTFVHFPLSGHRFAIPAARAVECAADQGRFESMFNTLYSQQEYFGLKSWTDLASAAGISDLVAFDACIGRQELPADILSGKELATDLGLHGTPTLIINGWVLGHTPRFQELDAAVTHVLAGHDLSSYLAPKSWFGWLRN